MRIGVLTGGGDGSGLNTVLCTVAQSLINQAGAEVIGIEDGFLGLQGRWPNPTALAAGRKLNRASRTPRALRSRWLQFRPRRARR